MAYEHLGNEQIVAAIAVKSILTPYEMRMAAGERITQQAQRIAELEADLAAERATVVTIPDPEEVIRLRRKLDAIRGVLASD